MQIIISDTAALVPGTWYAIGVKDLAEEIDWGGMPLHRYDGEGCWSNDAGEPVDTTWDAALQMTIGINSADAFQQQ